MNPNGRVGGAEYGTSCIGEPQRVSAVQISEKPLRNVPASVRREADRSQTPSWMRIPRLATAEHWYHSRPLGVPLPIRGLYGKPKIMQFE